MCRQPGQHAYSTPDTDGLGFSGARRAGPEGQDSRSGPGGLPSFVSAAPPRSEGEALLRRIFSRRECM
jgi:hypothetical protein